MLICFAVRAGLAQNSKSINGCKLWGQLVSGKLQEHQSLNGKPGIHLAVNFNDPFKTSELSTVQKMSIIECMLDDSKNKNFFFVSGTMRPEVSQIFAEAPSQLQKLYAISYVYTENYLHGDGVALWCNLPDFKCEDPKKQYTYATTQEAIDRATKYYRTWFAKVEEIGWEKAEELDLQPLDGSGIAWYGNSVRPEQKVK